MLAGTWQVAVAAPDTIWSDDFSTDKGWTGYGGAAEWERLPATASVGCWGNQDPDTDNSPSADDYILGNDIGGCYNDYVSLSWITSPSIDCSDYTGIQFSYYRWLGLESWDDAYIEVWNGSSWNQIEYYGSGVNDSSWTYQSYDVSTYADQNSDFKIRFGLATDLSVTYCGWNIDDIEITGTPINDPPAAPTLHDVPFDNEETPDTTPSFEFTANDPDGTAGIVYQIQWDDDPDFGTPTTKTSDTDAGFENTVTPSDISPFNEGEKIRFTIQSGDALSNSAADTAYYWRVRAKDDLGEGGSGNYGDWTTRKSLRVNTSLSLSQWVQTTDEQFDTGTLNDTETYESDQVRLIVSPEEIKESYTTGDDSEGNSSYWYGQVFKHSQEFVITKIRVLMVRSGTGTHHFYLRETTGDPAVPKAGSANNLRTATRTYTSGDPITATWYEYVFDSEYTIPADTYYAIVHEKNAFVQWRRDATSPTYANGHYCYDDDDAGTWGYRTERDHLFEIWGYVPIPSSGTIMSPAIDYDWLSGATSWDEFNWSEYEDTVGTVKMQLYYKVTTDGDTIVPESALSGNSSGFTSGPVDISSLDTTTYNRISLKATLEKGTGTPYLQDWTVKWSAAQTWYLSSDVGYIMYKADTSKPAGTVPVADDEFQIWIANEAAAVDVGFPANTWTGHVTFDADSLDTTVRVYVGKWDGSVFTPSAGDEYADVSGSSDFSFSAGAFDVPQDEWLACKIEDYADGDSDSVIVSVGLNNSYLTSPASDPGYPIPELPTIILLGAGLACLGGYVYFMRRKRRSVSP